MTIREGRIAVDSGEIWYRVVGDGAATPLLTLHGGPGYPHPYLLPLDALAVERPVIFYDQLGCGNSPCQADPAFWRIERFVTELAQVRDALDLDCVHLFGHSWGAMLAVDYLLTRPDGVSSAILASPALSIPRWLEDTARMVRRLPPAVQATIEGHQAAGTTSTREYHDAVMEFNRRHLCRIFPFPEAMKRSHQESSGEVYSIMWGPSEFYATGNLKAYDRTALLSELTLPVLFTCGRYDESTPEACAWYQSLTPGSRLEVFENSAHMAHLEETDAYLDTVRRFLCSAPPR